MATIVSTGQITIVDNNDAKPITAYITANGTIQQTYVKDDATETFNPNWETTNLVLTAKVYVGLPTGATEMGASLTGIKWSNDLSTALTTGTNYTVSSNVLTVKKNILTEAAPTKIFYFEGDYTDPSTGLTSHVIAQITLGLVKTGTNAVYLDVIGINAIQESNTNVKNKATMTANLMRGSNIDDVGTTYKWFVSPYRDQDQIDADYGDATLRSYYTFKNTAGTVVSLPSGGTFADVKTLEIDERAVTDIGLYKVVAKSADGVDYTQYFVVYDVSDPYDLRLISTAGDKLQNGVGSTNIYPITYNGSSVITNTVGWTFEYEFYDANGAKGAFVDPSITARTIVSNNNSSVTVNTLFNPALADNTVIKVVSATGTVRYYEINGPTSSTTINLDLDPDPNTFCSKTQPTVNEFQNGTLYVCQGSATTGVITRNGGINADRKDETANPPDPLTNPLGGTHYLNSKIIVTGNDIDTKGTIVCKANRP